MTTSFGTISPSYENATGTRTITIESENNRLHIEDTSLGKEIYLSAEDVSNGVDSLSWVDIYETVDACQAVVYPPTLSTILTVQDTIQIKDTGTSDVEINANYLRLSQNTGSDNLTLNPNGIISTANVDLSLTAYTNKVIVDGAILDNHGGYIQATASNAFGPITVPSSNFECLVITNPSNAVQMDTFTNYLYGTSGGWTCKIINQCGSSFVITTPDAKFTSWLHGVVGASYDIPDNSYIQLTALDPSVNGLGFNEFFVEDGSGYKTVNTNANAQHYINFSDSSSTGVGNIQKTGGLQFNPSTNVLTITDGTNSVNINPTSNPATSIFTTDINTGGPYYPVFVDGAGQKTAFVDIATSPWTYSPSTGTLSPAQITCNVMNQTTTGAACTLFSGITNGSVSIAGNSLTTGQINIGSTTATTGLCNIRPPLVLLRQLRTTNNTTYSPSNVLDLGFTTTTFGSSFTTTALASSTNTNLMSYTFTSANFGTYLFSASCIITPTDTTAERQVIISISGSSATITQPYYDMQFIPIAGSSPQLSYTRVIPIYAATTIYLVGYCNGSAANVQTTSNNGLFTYTRIA